jgi:hypothetical protein
VSTAPHPSDARCDCERCASSPGARDVARLRLHAWPVYMKRSDKRTNRGLSPLRQSPYQRHISQLIGGSSAHTSDWSLSARS